MLRAALAAFGDGMPPDEELHWLWLASVAALRVWDDDRWATLSARYLQLAREVGALSELPLALVSRAYLLLFSGELTAAADADRRGAGGEGRHREQPRAVWSAGPGRVARRRGRASVPWSKRPRRR